MNAARAISLTEFLLGAGIVLGHNVWHVVPNEVPILAALALLSFRLRDGSFCAMGLRRPPSWGRILAIAAGAAVLRLGAGAVIEQLTSQIWPPIVAPKGADEITGNLGNALLALGIVWSFAAFGEEIAYRGYLLNRCAQALGGGAAALAVAAVLSAVLFGYGHYYKGPAGILDSGVAGLILAGAYLAAGRNLWACVLAHGFIDTIGVTLAYLGLDT